MSLRLAAPIPTTLPLLTGVVRQGDSLEVSADEGFGGEGGGGLLDTSHDARDRQRTGEERFGANLPRILGYLSELCPTRTRS